MTPQQDNAFQTGPAAIDVRRILFRYLKHWYLFVAGVSLCLGLALLYLRYATPQYQVSSTLLVKDDERGADVISGTTVFNDLDIFRSTKKLENEIEVLRSRGLMQRTLKELSLYTTYYVDGRVKDREVYGQELPLRIVINQLNAGAFGRSVSLHLGKGNGFELEAGDGTRTPHRFGEQIRKPYGVFTVVAAPRAYSTDGRVRKKIIVRFNDIEKLADGYSQLLTVEPVNKKASVIAVRLTDAVPEKGRDIINKLIEVYNLEGKEERNALAGTTIRFIDDRLAYLSSELSAVEKDVATYKQQNQVTDVSSEAGMYLEKSSAYNKQLSDLGIQIDVLQSIERYLNKGGDRYQLVPSTLSIDDPTLVSLITRFNELQLDRERTLRTTQPGNPLVQNINEQLATLRTNILENLRNIRNGLEITRKNLQATSGQFASKIQQVPLIERELLEINRQQGIKQQLYLYLLQKREEAALIMTATVPDTRVIDAATSEADPVKPKKLIVLLVALLAGLGGPFAFVLAGDVFGKKVRQRSEVERAGIAPILGEIGHNGTRDLLVATGAGGAALGEQFHFIRSFLAFSPFTTGQRVILVTSGMRGDGKTFFALNLGASLALAGKKAAVVECDLRKAGLLQALRLPAGPGVAEYLGSGEASPASILHPVPGAPGLFVAGAGAPPANPAGLLSGPQVKRLLDALKEEFDYVLVVAPPLGEAADALALAPHCDATLLLVRYNHTTKTRLAALKSVFERARVSPLHVVLNDAGKENGSA